MRWPPVRFVLLAVLLAPGAAAAQPAAAPAGAGQGAPRVAAAPRTAVQRAPLVAAKPGGTAKPAAKPGGKPGGKPGARPVAKPPAVPVPAPAAAPEPDAEKPAEPGKGSATGAPLPRFAALRSDEVNLRAGPGTRYPIDWLYKRRDLPVQIEREFEAWRLIRDHEGVKGWVNQAVLVPRRTGIVIDGEHVLRGSPRDDASPVARLKPGVILRLRSCDAGADWCQATVGDYRGWIKRADIWGTFPGEAIQ